MSFLYRNVKGYPVQAHSYSGGSEYSDCPQKYDYSRRQGYKEKDKSASMQFGNALEAALQYYHASNLDLYDTIDEWKRLWLVHQKDTTIDYSAKDGDWETMYVRGADMLRLYAVKRPDLPIHNPAFQVNFKKELYPDTEYAGLQYTSFVDMLCTVDEKHPLLPPASQPGERQLIVDIKTAANPFPEDPRLSGMDPQLRAYAWSTGIETVSFLVFVKRGLEAERGDTVTLLESFRHDPYPAGTELVVLDATKNLLTLVLPEVYDAFKDASKGIKGSALKDVIAEFAKAGYECERKETTKQRLQFLAAVISEKDRKETGEVIGSQAIQICDADKQNFFPKKPGIRFPNNHCTFCSYLGLCIGDEKMVEEKLVQIGNVAPKTDWLNEI